MASELHSLFPTPVFTTNYPAEPQLYSFLKNQELMKKEKEVSNLYGELSNDVRILRNSECKGLREFIIHNANILAKEILGYKIETMVDVLSWVTIKRTGQSHIAHTHPNSVLSGVYYFDKNVESMPIIFMRKKIEGYNAIRIPIDIKNESTFCQDNYTLNPKQGDIVMFPSYLTHTVGLNTTHMDRYSLAFNLMPKGGIGSVDELTHFFYADAL
jgi:uncharacterized protein (TIGR02466 family)